MCVEGTGELDARRDPGPSEGRFPPPGSPPAGPHRKTPAVCLSRNTTSSHPKGLLPPCSESGGMHSGSLRTGQGHFCCHFLRGRAFTVTSGDRQPRASLPSTRGKTGAEPQLKTGREGLLEEETGRGPLFRGETGRGVSSEEEPEEAGRPKGRSRKRKGRTRGRPQGTGWREGREVWFRSLQTLALSAVQHRPPLCLIVSVLLWSQRGRFLALVCHKRLYNLRVWGKSPCPWGLQFPNM